MSVVALSGGIGGAKLSLGLKHVLPTDALTVIANTGDDFEHLGLVISPDIDTTVYTLSGLANTELGWGRAGETWSFMASLKALGGEAWFNLGDGDLALHVLRTRRLAAGETLSAITADFCRRLGVGARVVPMSDQPVRTMVHTPDGALLFQHYFVRERCEPRVTGFEFAGAAVASPAPAALRALADPGLEAVAICPSNPFISIDPILAVPGMRAALLAAAAPRIAVSPIVAGAAIKGPTAKMMAELGLPSSAVAVAEHYRGLIDGFVLDEADAPLAGAIEALGMAVRVAPTLMRSLDDRTGLARAVLDFAATLRR